MKKLHITTEVPDISFIVCIKDYDQTAVLEQRLSEQVSVPSEKMRDYHMGGIGTFNTKTGLGQVCKMKEPYSYASHYPSKCIAYTSGDVVYVQSGGEVYELSHPLLRHVHSVRFSASGTRILIASAGTDIVMEVELYKDDSREFYPHVIWCWSAWENRPDLDITTIPPEGLATCHRPYSINGAEYESDGANVLVSSFKGSVFILHIMGNRVCRVETMPSLVTPHSYTLNHHVESKRGIVNVKGVEYDFTDANQPITRDERHGEWIQSITEIKEYHVVTDSHRSCFWIIDLKTATISCVRYHTAWAVHEVTVKHNGLLMHTTLNSIKMDIKDSSIPFNAPLITTNEEQYIARCFRSSKFSGGGMYTKTCEDLIASALRFKCRPDVLLTSSCTDSLEMCAVLLRLKPGDEVIVPNYTFVSTVNAFVIHGALPVYCDVDSVTGNIDPIHLRSLVTEKTRAICIIHYGGVACNMDAIMEIIDQYKICLIEDAAHALGSVYFNPTSNYHLRPLATFGDLATFSFHETKNIQCGEGGALVINNESLSRRAKVILEKGTDRIEFLNGTVSSYGWCDVGSSYVPSEVTAAMLCAQLENLTKVNERRVTICDWYRSNIRGNFVIPPKSTGSNGHIFHIVFQSSEMADKCVKHMKGRGIALSKHYLPLNESSFGKQWKTCDTPASSKLAGCLVRLPLFYSLTKVELNRIAVEFKNFAKEV